LFVSGTLTLLTIEESLSLLKQFHCCSPQCNTDGMFKNSRVCV